MKKSQVNEIYSERKYYIMADIKKSQSDLQLFQRCLVKFGKKWQQTIDLEKEWFNSRTEDLIKLKKWFAKHK